LDSIQNLAHTADVNRRKTLATTAETTTNPIVLSYYLGFSGKRRWQFKDANSGGILKVGCSQTSPNKLELSLQSDKIDSQHLLSVEGSEFWGHKITWVESKDKQLGLIKWRDGGVHFPYGWKPGDSVSGITEGTVGGFGHGSLTLQFVNFAQLKVPSWSPLPQTNGIFTPYGDDTEMNKSAVIEVKAALKIQELGTVVFGGNLFFAYGLGIVAANANIMGVFQKLDLQNWGK
jgi:hypothetical protein